MKFLTGRSFWTISLTLFLTSCDGCQVQVTSNWGEQTVKVIKTNLAEQIGFGELDVNCETVPKNPKAGDTLNCTGTTADKRVVKFVSKMGDNGIIQVNVTNVIVKDLIQQVLTTVLPAIKHYVGKDVEIANVDCGNQSILLKEDNSFSCQATSPSTQEKKNIKITADATGFNFRVQTEAANPPSEDNSNKEDD